MTRTRPKPPRFSAKTHVGLVREVNEDSIVALPNLGIWAVADGMGGHYAGDFASQTVIDALSALPHDLEPGNLVAQTRAALQMAHAEIQTHSHRNGDAIIGSTVVLLAIAERHFMCLWAGDSRLYHLRDRQLEMISIDHSVVGEMVAAGQLTWDEAEQHQYSNQITRAVGVGETLDIDKRRGEVAPGDRFLLCSDGLTKYADQATLARIIADCPIDTLANDLLQVALDGGASDNVSIIAIEI
jgi:serine/threonine protein phosphatase PrpC